MSGLNIIYKMFFDQYVKEVLNPELNCDGIFRDQEFRRYVIKTKGKCLETVKFFQEPLKITLKKPQRCLYSDTDYYLGLDSYTKTYYLCYRHLLMIDLDLDKNPEFSSRQDYINFLKEYCHHHPELLFRVFETRKGLHCFAINQKYNYTSDKALQLMLDLKCDFYYVIFSSIRGWSVRLNRKNEDKVDKLYDSLGDIGTGQSILELEQLVDLHLNFSELFINREVSQMR